MSFTDDIDEVRRLVSDIVSNLALPQATVGWPDSTALSSALTEAGLATVAFEADDPCAQENLVATAGVQLGLADHGLVFPTARFDLLPAQLAAAAGLKDVLKPRSLLVPFDAVAESVPIPWADHAEQLVVHRADAGRAEIALIDDIDLGELRMGIDGSPAHTVSISSPPDWVAVEPAALARATSLDEMLSLAVIATVLNRITRLVARYVGERTQFGRAIGRFQAVQALVSDCAAHTEMVGSVRDSCFGHLCAGRILESNAQIELTAGALVALDAVEVGVRNSHQALGAIGTTLEHPLQRYTRSLLQLRRGLAARDTLLDRLSALLTADDRTTWELIAQ